MEMTKEQYIMGLDEAAHNLSKKTGWSKSEAAQWLNTSVSSGSFVKEAFDSAKALAKLMPFEDAILLVES